MSQQWRRTGSRWAGSIGEKSSRQGDDAVGLAAASCVAMASLFLASVICDSLRL
jgi:hypothetical protein